MLFQILFLIKINSEAVSLLLFLFLIFTKIKSAKPYTKQEMREYFDKYAKAEGFDPSVPENWIHFNSTLFLTVLYICEFIIYFETNTLLDAFSQTL